MHLVEGVCEHSRRGMCRSSTSRTTKASANGRAFARSMLGSFGVGRRSQKAQAMHRPMLHSFRVGSLVGLQAGWFRQPLLWSGNRQSSSLQRRDRLSLQRNHTKPRWASKSCSHRPASCLPEVVAEFLPSHELGLGIEQLGHHEALDICTTCGDCAAANPN